MVRDLVFSFATLLLLLPSLTAASPWIKANEIERKYNDSFLAGSLRVSKLLELNDLAYHLAQGASETVKGDRWDAISQSASSSRAYPPVFIWPGNRYYCDNEVEHVLYAADSVHHSVVWLFAVRGLRELVQLTTSSSNSSLTPEQIKKVNASIDLARRGLIFFRDRDRVLVNGSNEWNFTYKTIKNIPECVTKNANLHGQLGQLNYNAAAAHLALELERFFELPDPVLQKISLEIASNKSTYLGQVKELREKITNYLFTIVPPNSLTPAFWHYIPGGRPEDTAHGALLVNYFVTLREYGLLSSSLEALRLAFLRQYSSGPSNVHKYFDLSYGIPKPYHKIYKSEQQPGSKKNNFDLASWSYLLSIDCELSWNLKQMQNYAGVNQFIDSRIRYSSSKFGCAGSPAISYLDQYTIKKGQHFHTSPSRTNNRPITNCEVIIGRLPLGININSKDCSLSGTPTESTENSVATIRASNFDASIETTVIFITRQ